MSLDPVLPVMLAAVVVAQASPAIPAVDAKELGRLCTAQFFAGEIDPLWDRFSLKMKEGMKSKEAFKAFQQKAVQDLGPETEVVDEIVTPLMNFQVYMRTVKTARWPAPVEFTWSFDDKGTVVGFYVKPKKQLAETRFLDYKTRAALKLPFKGAWTVVWGGRTLEQNYHAMTKDQRFAYDFLVLKAGVSHSGDGSKNEQYYAYGQPILAPAAGKVVSVVDGLPDNKPGEMDPLHAPGNHVVIDHGNGEFSFLCHLKPGSLKVKSGQAVKVGQTLGLCGNSGNTSEAHLHYHLQNTAKFGQGEGLPAQFQGYVADGDRVTRGEPIQGQVIQP